MKKLTLILSTFLISAQALSSPNLMPCTGSAMGGKLLNGCSIPTVELFAAQTDVVTFRVDVAFQCSPGGENFLNINLKTDSTEQPIPFGKRTTVQIDGKGPLLLIDSNTSKTSRALFNAGCTLEVTNITAQPTFATLENWSLQANQITKRLSSDAALYSAAQQSLLALQWDAEQIQATRARLATQIEAALLAGGLTLDSVLYPETDAQPERRGTLKRLDEMPDVAKWTALLESNSHIVDDMTLWIQVNSIEKGRPAYNPTFVAQLLSILKDDVSQAQSILARGNTWLANLDADHRAIHEKVKAQIANLPDEAKQ